jgi:putative hydrolase of the HAD superfamily
MRRTLILDVGNVILPFDPLRPCRLIARKIGLSPEEIRSRIYGAKLEWEFEAGKITGEQFTHGCGRELGIEFTVDEFRPIWSDMLREDVQVSQLVRELNARHQVILLSNTNEWHWSFCLERFPVISEVRTHVLSFQVGALKPDRKIYAAALQQAEAPKQALFIDDIQRNVEGAREAGLQAIQYCNIEQLRADLSSLGFI